MPVKAHSLQFLLWSLFSVWLIKRERELGEERQRMGSAKTPCQVKRAEDRNGDGLSYHQLNGLKQSDRCVEQPGQSIRSTAGRTARQGLDWMPVCALSITNVATCQNFLVSEVLGFVETARGECLPSHFGGKSLVTPSPCLSQNCGRHFSISGPGLSESKALGAQAARPPVVQN